ncbi:hypothetical protein C0993_005450 [Termitomyces sp. T159_Od127]|nr:hypothetical protein C0993_005450 [Termitomyces sp. T159_Od127]
MIRTRDARKFLEKYKRVDAAIDAYYNNPHEFNTPARHQPAPTAPSTSKLTTLFNKYKEFGLPSLQLDPDGDEITVDGTIKLCGDLEVDPEDVVLLAVAFELRSPGIGRWTKQGWTEGWKALGVDSIPAMKGILPKLATKLSNDQDYFRKVYNHTFEFGRSEGQRSLGLSPLPPLALSPELVYVWCTGIDSAQAFWGLLVPHGLKGPALSHINAESSDGDVSMEYEEGWRPEYIDWWFDYLNQKGGKSVSRDTWVMVCHIYPLLWFVISNIGSVFGLLAFDRFQVSKL